MSAASGGQRIGWVRSLWVGSHGWFATLLAFGGLIGALLWFTVNDLTTLTRQLELVGPLRRTALEAAFLSLRGGREPELAPLLALQAGRFEQLIHGHAERQLAPAPAAYQATLQALRHDWDRVVDQLRHPGSVPAAPVQVEEFVAAGDALYDRMRADGVERLLFRMALIGPVSSLELLLAVVALRSMRHQLGRIRHMTQVADVIWNGRVDARVADGRPDELGELGRTIDRMTAELGVLRQFLEEAQGALAQRERNLDALVSQLLTQANEVVVVLDGERMVRACNTRGEAWLRQLLGRQAPGYLVGWKMGDATVAQLEEPALRALFQLSAGESNELGRVRFGERWLELTGSCSAEGLLLIGHDVTDRLELEAQLAHGDRLATAGSLAAGIVHEVANPVAFISSNLELLRQRKGEPLGADDWVALEDAIEGCRRISEVVRDMKSLVRHESSEADLPVSLHDALELALRLARPSLRGRASVEMRLTAGVPRVKGSIGKLTQVFLNLVVNAAEAMVSADPRRNHIRIATHVEGERLIATVEDNGRGLEKHQMERLFVPFFTTKPPGQGTGLGLSISRTLIEGLGGTLVADSTSGLGSRFTLTVPLHPSSTNASRSGSTLERVAHLPG